MNEKGEAIGQRGWRLRVRRREKVRGQGYKEEEGLWEGIYIRKERLSEGKSKEED